MRIIGGQLRGRKIFEAPDSTTRPLKDLTRESIFNILEHSKNEKLQLNKSNVLDLFSGIGSFGLECISRGSSKVFFFEKHKPSINTLEKNIQNLNCQSKSKVFREDVFSIFKNQKILKKRFDLIFLDPPFKEKNINFFIDNFSSKKVLSNKGIIIIHRNKKIKEEYSENLKILRIENYGISKIIFAKIN